MYSPRRIQNPKGFSTLRVGVKEGVELLGLSWKDAIFEDQLIVHDKYGVDLRKTDDYRFDSVPQTDRGIPFRHR